MDYFLDVVHLAVGQVLHQQLDLLEQLAQHLLGILNVELVAEYHLQLLEVESQLERLPQLVPPQLELLLF
jgi:hypothetical protein